MRSPKSTRLCVIQKCKEDVLSASDLQCALGAEEEQERVGARSSNPALVPPPPRTSSCLHAQARPAAPPHWGLHAGRVDLSAARRRPAGSLPRHVTTRPGRGSARGGEGTLAYLPPSLLSSFPQAASATMTWDGSLAISALQAAYASGTTTPTEVARAVHERLTAYAALDPAVWIDVVPLEALLARAAELEEAYEGRDKPALFGVPMSVKNSIDVAGFKTTLACPDFAYVPEKTAPAVERALEAGALLVGTTNLDQFATVRDAFSESPLCTALADVAELPLTGTRRSPQPVWDAALRLRPRVHLGRKLVRFGRLCRRQARLLVRATAFASSSCTQATEVSLSSEA